MALTTYFAQVTHAINALGSYVQLVASTPYNSSRCHIIIANSTAARNYEITDIATGAASSETVIISQIPTETDADFGANICTSFDVDIPIGSRLAVRSKGSGANTLNVLLLLEDRALGSLANPVTYGVDSTFSKGYTVDPGGTANTKGAYTEITPSTSARIDALTVCTSQLAVTPTGFIAWYLDIATGAASSETVVLPDLKLVCNANGDVPRPAVMRFPVSIPAGTRLSARCECSITLSTDRQILVSLIGMQQP